CMQSLECPPFTF
nr:immunoglobulin light chain junction region [Macaca mulatta]